MTVSVVNGYVCYNCTDEEKAQKGIDPSNRTKDPALNPAAVAKREEAAAIAKAKDAQDGKPTSDGQRSTGLPAPGTGVELDVTV